MLLGTKMLITASGLNTGLHNHRKTQQEAHEPHTRVNAQGTDVNL